MDHRVIKFKSENQDKHFPWHIIHDIFVRNIPNILNVFNEELKVGIKGFYYWISLYYYYLVNACKMMKVYLVTNSTFFLSIFHRLVLHKQDHSIRYFFSMRNVWVTGKFYINICRVKKIIELLYADNRLHLIWTTLNGEP